MAPGVSLDNQFFWTQPRRKHRTLVGSTRSKPIVSPYVQELSMDEPTCISSCESPDGTDNNTANANGNMGTWQLDNAVRLPTVPRQQDFSVDDVARSRASSCECEMGIDGFQQQAPAIVSDPEKTDDVENLAPQLASPSSPSSTSFGSQSTPITTPDENMLSDYRNSELYPIDPALTGLVLDCGSTCYPLIDLGSAPDASDTVAPENSLLPRDGLGLALNCYASDSPSCSAASNPSWRAVGSKSDPGEIRGCLKRAANPDQRLRKRASLADIEIPHGTSDGRRAKADEHRPTLGCGPSFTGGNHQLGDNSVEPPSPKRRKVDRSSKDGNERDEESRSRSCSVGSTIRVEPHTSTPALNISESPVADTATTDSQDNVGMAEFGEWPLHNVLLKRITLNGVATFQLQFDWNLCATHSQLGRAIPKRRNKLDGSDRPKRTTDDSATRAKFTPDEDNLIAALKEEQQLPWTEIHRIHQGHSRQFPTRSKESLQVRYCTKLKTRRGPIVQRVRHHQVQPRAQTFSCEDQIN
ncbi:myb family transcription factor, partial [Metarhizium majus ARSEF 297]